MGVRVLDLRLVSQLPSGDPSPLSPPVGTYDGLTVYRHRRPVSLGDVKTQPVSLGSCGRKYGDDTLGRFVPGTGDPGPDWD